MPELPPEAIEAAAGAMSDDWNPDRDPVLTAMNRDYATSALTAALPHIEAAIREQERERIKRAIEAAYPRYGSELRHDGTEDREIAAYGSGMRDALSIALTEPEADR